MATYRSCCCLLSVLVVWCCLLLPLPMPTLALAQAVDASSPSLLVQTGARGLQQDPAQPPAGQDRCLTEAQFKDAGIRRALMPFCSDHLKWPPVVNGELKRLPGDEAAEADYNKALAATTGGGGGGDSMARCAERLKSLACQQDVPSCKSCTQQGVCGGFEFCSDICWNAVWECSVHVRALTADWVRPLLTCNTENAERPAATPAQIGIDGQYSDSLQQSPNPQDTWCTPWRCGDGAMATATCVNSQGRKQPPAKAAVCKLPQKALLEKFANRYCTGWINYPIIHQTSLIARWYDSTGQGLDIDIDTTVRRLRLPGLCLDALSQFACNLAIPVCDKCNEQRCHQLLPCVSSCEEVERVCQNRILDLTQGWKAVAPVSSCHDRRLFCEGADCNENIDVGSPGCLSFHPVQTIKRRDGSSEVLLNQLDAFSPGGDGGMPGWQWAVIWASCGVVFICIIWCVCWIRQHNRHSAYEADFMQTRGMHNRDEVNNNYRSQDYDRAAASQSYRKMSDFAAQDLQDNPMRMQAFEARAKLGFTKQNAFFSDK
jgi:hypothetical protein